LRHKLETDEDVINKRCEFPDCKTRASFGDPVDCVSRWCVQHKSEKDEDVVSRKCEYKDCKTQPSYGDPSDLIRRRCKEHKLPKDESLGGKRCEVKDCKIRTSFGDPNDWISRRCAEHKLDTDENRVSHRYESQDCKTVPIFGDPVDRIRKRCLKHKLPTDEDVVNKKCIKCHVYRVYFHDICSICDPTLNERKEYKVVKFLRSHGNEKLHDFVHNRILPNNDGIRYRPDILLSFSDSAIIVEIKGKPLSNWGRPPI
jgi:hypothetical protein